MFTIEPNNSIMYLSYIKLIQILNENEYQVIQQANQFVLLKDNEIVANVDTEQVKEYLTSRPNLTYVDNVRIYYEYKDYTRANLQELARKALERCNLIIYIYAIRYLCNELQQTNKIFNLSY